MAKRVTRIYTAHGDDYIAENYGNPRHTVKRTFFPEDEFDFKETGLESEVRLNRIDLDKLNDPTKIRVTVTVID